MKVFRFQGTKDIERNSYFEDIMDIWFSINFYREEDIEPSEEDLEDIYYRHRNTLSMRKNIDSLDLFHKIVKCNTEEDAWDLCQKYKMCGVFAIHPIPLNEAYKASLLPKLGIDNTYLIEAEAELIEDFGREYGLLVNIEQILNIYETPIEFKKNKK